MNKYDLIVISAEPFPYGQAATNRMLSYLQGLAKDRQILYLCFAAPTVGASSNQIREGEYNGIKFRYLTNPVTRCRQGKLIRACALVWRYLLLCFFLLFRSTCKTLLIYSSKPLMIKIVRFVAWVKHVNLFRDITELVGANYSKTPAALAKMKAEMSKLSGLIVISQGIYDYFDNISSEDKFLLPVLVDINRFSLSCERKKTIFVCSGSNLERDGLLDSLNGFILFNERHPGYIFEIASSINMFDPYHKKCKELIDRNSDVIHFLGPLPSYDIPMKMASASLLILTPHNNYQTKGFPTKLGEYLASGTPTICSMIDDIKDVISDDIVFGVQPNSPQMIADSIFNIFENYEAALAIGKSARSYMQDKYTVDSYKSHLLDFLKI